MRPDAPLGPGSVSLRLYTHDDLSAPGAVEELRAQARVAAEAGFAGLMISEHHGGFAGYLPNPIQAAGFLLCATADIWVAPCPVVLPLRPAALVAEEVAWLAAAHPGRVGVGLAAGALESDFAAMGLSLDEAPARFAAALGQVVAWLHGRDLGGLAGDRALQRCAEHPVPVVSAAVSPAAARRAARVDAGILLDSMTALARQRRICDEYLAAGGTGPRVAIRRVWLGSAPEPAIRDRRARYEGFAADTARRHWGAADTIVDDDPVALAEQVAESVAAAGADAVNLRVHAPQIPPAAVREQIRRLGYEVLPHLNVT